MRLLKKILLYFLSFLFMFNYSGYAKQTRAIGVQDSMTLNWELLKGNWVNYAQSKMNFDIDYKQKVIVGKIYNFSAAPPPAESSETFIIYLNSNRQYLNAIGVDEKAEKIEYIISNFAGRIIFNYSRNYRLNGELLSMHYRKTYHFISKDKISTTEEISEDGINYKEYSSGEWARK